MCTAPLATAAPGAGAPPAAPAGAVAPGAEPVKRRLWADLAAEEEVAARPDALQAATLPAGSRGLLEARPPEPPQAPRRQRAAAAADRAAEAAQADRLLKLWDYDEGVCKYVGCSAGEVLRHRPLLQAVADTGVGHSGQITCAAISPDQTFIVSAGTEGSVLIWTMPDAVLQQCHEGPLPGARQGAAAPSPPAPRPKPKAKTKGPSKGPSPNPQDEARSRAQCLAALNSAMEEDYKCKAPERASAHHPPCLARALLGLGMACRVAVHDALAAALRT
ncbi:unnamed protein product [Prorocentrum cordatum]|uniref:Uncharacterized protein n=1 Tax=Prorocentrum cordatum TaxID=2364126 RepID=A0ABN9RI48_9DINO|nr:unnamed protein product [Polarella glacialis]